MNSLFYWLIPLLCLGVSTATAQSLRGRVITPNANGSETPVSFAAIYSPATQTGTQADSLGYFNLPQAKGGYMLVISAIGFNTDTVRLAPGALHAHVTLQPVEVVASQTVEVMETALTTLKPVDAVANTTMMREAELQKAACCNLGESFETSASVDVSYTDAVSGARQIQMLGLPGTYTQLQMENVPAIRGLSANYGLSFIPGTWVESIQLTKGAGSVVNGFESISGIINIEQKKPDGDERIFANLYLNQMGRTEGNLNLARKLGNTVSTGLYLHGDFMPTRLDRNRDGFMDIPLSNNFAALNRWKYNGKVWKAQLGLSILQDNRLGGQAAFRETLRGSNSIYGVAINTQRNEAFAKLGRVYDAPYKSLGLIVSALNYTQDASFGLRTYNARQKSACLNFIYQSIIGTTTHKFRTGISYQGDFIKESLDQDRMATPLSFERAEQVPGAFYEHTYTPNESVVVTGGLRADYNSIYGAYVTPRLHAKWVMDKATTLRLSAGNGRRTANILAENASALASSRELMIMGSSRRGAFGLRQEVAWNYGLSLAHDLTINNRAATLTMDAYSTNFNNQVVVDMETPGMLMFYNLAGKSYSHSLQTEFTYSPVRRLDIRTAYRYTKVDVAYESGLKSRLYIPRRRAFVNVAYTTRSKWKLDYTIQLQGSKRLAPTSTNPAEYQMPAYSPGYITMNAQLTKAFKNGIDVYLGAENLTDYRQTSIIVAAEQPFSSYFDSSIVWGPLLGRMVYTGVRFKLVK